MMRASVLARLRAHGLLELAREVARRHRVGVDELDGRALSELGIEMASQGWSDRNIARLLELGGQNITSGSKYNQAPAPVVVPIRRAPARKKPVAVPSSAPVHLVVLPIEKLRAPLERFRCAPYAATIRGETCVERQKIARTPKGGVDRNWSSGRGPKVEFPACKNCPDGARVAAQLGEKLPAPPKAAPAVVDEPEEASA